MSGACGYIYIFKKTSFLWCFVSIRYTKRFKSNLFSNLKLLKHDYKKWWIIWNSEQFLTCSSLILTVTIYTNMMVFRMKKRTWTKTTWCPKVETVRADAGLRSRVIARWAIEKETLWKGHWSFIFFPVYSTVMLFYKC